MQIKYNIRFNSEKYGTVYENYYITDDILALIHARIQEEYGVVAQDLCVNQRIIQVD